MIIDCLKSLTKFNIIIVDNGKNYNLLDELKKQKNISEGTFQTFLAINNICFPKNLTGELM